MVANKLDRPFTSPPRTFFLNCTLVDGYKTPSPESHLSLSAGRGQVVGQSRLAKELSGQVVLCQMQLASIETEGYYIYLPTAIYSCGLQHAFLHPLT